MSSPTYWLNLFSGKTWSEFIEHGADVTGFRDTRSNQVRKIDTGDRLICYVTGISQLIGLNYVRPDFLKKLSEDCYPEEEG
jgi:hypothetical protein